MSSTDILNAAISTIASQLTIMSDAVASIETPGTPITRPPAINCIGGTIPNAIAIPTGDGVPGGAIAEPYRTRMLNNLADGSVWIFGDSILQATDTNLISPFGTNWALGGQSLRRMINSLRTDFPQLHTAGAGVIMCGVNDLSNTSYYGARNAHSPDDAAATVVGMYANQLKNYLTGKWVICHLLPCNEIVTGAVGYNSQVAYVNSHLAGALTGCAAQIAFVPPPPILFGMDGNLKSEYHIGDGQHLNKAGSAIMAADIATALSGLEV